MLVINVNARSVDDVNTFINLENTGRVHEHPPADERTDEAGMLQSTLEAVYLPTAGSRRFAWGDADAAVETDPPRKRALPSRSCSVWSRTLRLRPAGVSAGGIGRGRSRRRRRAIAAGRGGRARRREPSPRRAPTRSCRPSSQGAASRLGPPEPDLRDAAGAGEEEQRQDGRSPLREPNPRRTRGSACSTQTSWKAITRASAFIYVLRAPAVRDHRRRRADAATRRNRCSC